MKKTTKRALSLPVLGAAVVGASSLLGAPAASASTTGGPVGSVSGTASSVVSGVSGTASKATSSLNSSAAKAGSAVSGTAAQAGSAAKPVTGTVSGVASAVSGAVSGAGAQAPDRAAFQPASAPASGSAAPPSGSTRAEPGSAVGRAAPKAAAGSGGGLGSDQPQVAHNAGAAGSYFLDHLQYEHLDQAYLGFGPAIQNPGYWFSNHIIPVFLNTGSLALTGNYYTGSMDDSGSGGAASSQVPQVAHNAGAAGSYFLDHLQYEHLDQAYLGFGPALQNPGYWFSGHLVPVFINTASLALTGDGSGGGM